MGGGDNGVGGGGVNGRVDWWNNLVMCGGGCREGVGCAEGYGEGVGVWERFGKGNAFNHSHKWFVWCVTYRDRGACWGWDTGSCGRRRDIYHTGGG